MERCNKIHEMEIENNPNIKNITSNNDNITSMEVESEKLIPREQEFKSKTSKLEDVKTSSELNCSTSTNYSNNYSSIDKSHNSINESYNINKSKELIFKIDNSNKKSRELLNYELLEEIYNNLIFDEKNQKLNIKKEYMNKQKDINQQMRAILIDWIIEVHNCFHLKQKTLYRCIYIIDLYLSNKIILRIRLQLLGAASLLIACKANEIYCPSLQQFIDITNGAYEKRDLLKMEKDILKTLNFEILSPTAEEFYNIICKVYNFNEVQKNLGNYFLDSSLIDYDLLKYKPSIIGLACAYIVMKFYGIKGYKDLYSTKMACDDSPQKSIKDCARDLCFLVKNLSNSNLRAAKIKFSSEEYGNVVAICEEK